MAYTLISATPSPYARKVRIMLAEKKIPFTLQTEVPWDSTTQTPQYNPLEKLPVLIDSATGKAVYESHFILDWIEAKHPHPPMLPTDVDGRLFAKQVEVVADGICDALVLCFFEKQRDQPSEAWKERQMRKVQGGLQALATWVEQNHGGPYLIGDSLTLADIAAGSVLGYMAVRWPEHPWREELPRLKAYWEALDQRESFATTRPSPQKISDRIV
ncbi:glutathione S-transferase domain-containing [Lecanosticta acicola]|uniref:Glutathione S-transferase domain-containing n=1 Tax=Lecanosticta acicola TaxID=111012 RepID=A0AAI8YUH6_9PEZI|nr:glutathione S-transferase domain-containing [Lecanosticta acicola]